VVLQVSRLGAGRRTTMQQDRSRHALGSQRGKTWHTQTFSQEQSSTLLSIHVTRVHIMMVQVSPQQ